MHQDSPVDIAHLHFLIAEDDEFQRHWLAVMLGKLGAVHVHEAADGNAAFELLQRPDTRIDISFIDLNMPGIDGIELVRRLAHCEHRTAIILTSALGPKGLICLHRTFRL